MFFNTKKGYKNVIFILTILLLFIICETLAFSQTYPFQNTSLTLSERLSDLMSRLTQAEKISLLHQYQPAISRLSIGAFRTGTEALHGIAWLGTATVFPQAIGLGSTWDTDLIKQIGSAVGDEARGFYKRNPVSNGLSLWAPVVDLERDPRAGRFEEGYSEDPYLTGQMAIAYCSGIKGDNSFYYKAIPTLKHFYAYNQEADRDTFSVNIDARNMHEYYLAPFRIAISAGAAKSMMTSYNLVNNVPCTVSNEINNFVKSKWVPSSAPYDFFVVTDAYAPSNLVNTQYYYSNMVNACAGMIKAGVDSMTQDGSSATATITNITSALSQGLITTANIDNAVSNILTVRFHTGEFDYTTSSNPYASLTESEICASDHAALSLKAARENIVLLKNSNSTLPLSKSISVAVIGPLADVVYTDFYSGTLPYSITPLDGIRTKVSSVTYAADNTNNAAAIAAAACTAAIVFVGNDPLCGDLGWGISRFPSEGKEDVDRTSISFETADQTLIQAVYAANPNTIVVLVSSFPYAINWENSNLPAIVYTSHAGQEIGTAVADVLFGDYNPAGRLTTTWYSSLSQIPAITSYDIINNKRTYLYFDQTPLYPFGHGLTYTTFTYSNLSISPSSISADSQTTITVTVQNTGSKASDEVVQLYVKDVSASVTRPLKQLLGFKRVNISAGSSQNVSFTLPAGNLAFWNTSSGDFYVEPGDFSIMAGRSSADIKLTGTLSVSSGTSTAAPTDAATAAPTDAATAAPTDASVTPDPTTAPTDSPAPTLTPAPTSVPTATPAGVTADPTASVTGIPTIEPTTPVVDTPAPTTPGTETPAPTTPTTVTADPTVAPADTTTPTTPPTGTTVPATGCTCTALCDSRTAITIPFTYDGASEFCKESSSLGTYVNSWNTDAVNINSINCTNTYVSSFSIESVNGMYYIYYKGSVSWAHIEIK